MTICVYVVAIVVVVVMAKRLRTRTTPPLVHIIYRAQREHERIPAAACDYVERPFLVNPSSARNRIRSNDDDDANRDSCGWGMVGRTRTPRHPVPPNRPRPRRVPPQLVCRATVQVTSAPSRRCRRRPAKTGVRSRAGASRSRPEARRRRRRCAGPCW